MLPSASLIHGGIVAARVVPPDILYRLARMSGSLGWWIAPGRRAIALDNMRHLVPELTPDKQRELARQLMPNLAEAAVDLFRLPSMTSAQLSALIDVTGFEHLQHALAQGRGVVLVSGHVGPYELGAAWIAAQGIPVTAMVEDLAKETAEALSTYRTATGVRLVTRNTGARQLYRVLKEGDLVALVADRMVGAGAPGVAVPYGDAHRMLPSGPAAFAVSTGALVVVGHIVRKQEKHGGQVDPHRGARYQLTLGEPIDPRGHETERLTATIGAQLAAVTQRHPDQWYVFQPGWLS